MKRLIKTTQALSGAILLALFQQDANAVTIPASYAMPAGSVNTNQPGFLVHPYQTTATEGGTIAWTEGQQAGLFGPNIADLSGADTNGYYTVTTFVSWGTQVDNFPEADPFPGIGSGSTENFSEEILTYVEFPTNGTYILGVNSDDGFSLTTSYLNPKDTSTAITLGKLDGNRGAADSFFPVTITQPGIYPMRLLYWQAGSQFSLAWFSATTNSTSTNYTLINDLSTPGALVAFATANVAPPYASAFNANPAGFGFVIKDDISALATNSVQVQLNGSNVPFVLSKSGPTTTISYTPATTFPIGSTNTVTVHFSDNAVPVHTNTSVFSFVVPNYVAMPASAAVPSSSVDTAQRGFTFRVNQIDSSTIPGSGHLAANIAHAEAQLNGLLVDPNTGLPYPDISTPGSQPDGSYVVTNLNFSYDLTAEEGAFTTAGGYPDSSFPGIVGSDSANMAGEIVAYLDLPVGFYTFAINATDGFRVTTGANPYDAAGTTLGLYDYRAITTETQFGIAVQTAGIYPIRLVWYRVGSGSNNKGDASLEFYTIDSLGNKVLVNDVSNPSSVKAYWKRTGSYGTFVKYAGPSSFVSPFVDSADVGFTNANVIISDGSTIKVNPASVVWSIDGAAVSNSVTASNGLATLTYNPPGLQIPRTAHSATVVWSDSGSGLAHTNSWNFHLLRNYILPTPVSFEDFESTPVDGNPSVPTGWTQVNFTGEEDPGFDSTDLNSDFYQGWVVVDVSFNISKDLGLSGYTPQVLNGVPFDENSNPLLVNHYIRAESDARENGPPGQIQYLYTKPYNLSGKTGVVIAFDSAYEQNQDNINALEYTVDGINYYPILYWLMGDFDSQAPADIYRDGLGNIDVVKTMTTTYGDVAMYTDPVSSQLVGGYYGFFIKAPISQALAPYIEGRYNDDGTESKRFEVYRVPQADNQTNVVFRFAQAGTSSWYWAIDNWGVYSVPSIVVQTPGKLAIAPSGGHLVLSWTGSGSLQSAASLSGPWTDVPNASSPMQISTVNAQQFYRLKQ